MTKAVPPLSRRTASVGMTCRDMTITIEPKGIELTDAIRTYAEEKFMSLTKYVEGIEKMDIDIGMESHHHVNGKVYMCSAHVFLRNKDFYVKKEAEELYKAIDKVKDHLRNELAEYKDRHLKKHRSDNA